jgi:hypothetical protein
VKALLQKGAEVDAADAQGSTALQLAAGSGDLTSVRTLLERGADPNAKQRFGWTALMKSAGHGDLEIVRLLIAHNADVNAVSGPDDGRVKHGPTVMGYLTPLHWAAVSGRDEIVRVLLDAGAKVDKPDVRGMTALMTAVSTDHASANMVRMFLQNGSDPSIKSEIGESTFDWARKFNNPAVLALLKLPPVTAASYVKPVVDAVTLTPRQAVERALPPIQRAADFIFKDNGCVACHAQPMAEMAANLARSRGWHVEESLSKTSLDAIRNQLITNVQPYLQGREGGGFPDSLLYATMALAANNVPPTPSTDSVVHYLAAKQYDAGYWEVFDGFRSPMQDGNFSRTAMAIRALAVYGTPGRKPEFDKRITQAAKWLASEAPFATEPHVMQLLGLYWANAAPRLRATGLRELTAQQHPDGGWSQNPYLETDAYATGQVLYAMHELGVPSTDPAFRRGVDFLLRTQQEDGTWHVKNRAMKLQPYFESGFPYEHDQWISSAATAWASMALSLSEPEQTKVAATR